MPFHLSKSVAAMMFASSLVGCAAVVKTPYEAPNVALPQSYAYAQNNKNQLILSQLQADQWWTLFNDAQLNQLINQVLNQNQDLAVAGLRLQQAWLQAGLARDQQGIRVGSAGFSTGHNFDLNSGTHSDSGISARFGLSYELDLFGKLAQQTEASRWSALATEQDLQATAQSLIGLTASLYWQLGYLHERYALSQQNLANSQKTFELVKKQYQVGAVSNLDLSQAQQSVQSQKANLSQIQQQLVETRTALAVLLNQSVQQLDLKEPQRLPNVNLPQIQAGLPAQLLARRPDLKAAELRLRQALANKDATTASYYPSISLTGNLGSSSTSLTQLLKNPVLSLGSSINLPFLQYNDMKKNLKISELEYEAVTRNYSKTLYQALAEVENALSLREQLDKQVQFSEVNLQLAQKVQKLTETRYQHGAIALKNVLDAQDTARNASLSLLQTKQNQYNAYVTLMQALGGSPLPPQS